MTRLTPPQLEEDEGGTLRSRSFGDIYYSPDDGLAETQHVFLGGNDVERRLVAGTLRVVGELGFGTGLNVMALLAQRDAGRSGPLHVWSCEGHPLPRGRFVAMQEATARRWPELASWAERLAAVYPDPVPGQAQFDLAPGVTLTIAFGPVQEMLAEAEFRADAWFLDGFSPAKNPAMWTPEVMGEVARLSAPGASAATFTVASSVRDALGQAGFSWQKAPGFGRKKHMLRARLDAAVDRSEPKPWFGWPTPAGAGGIAVIGAGIAGAWITRRLMDAGRSVRVFGGALRERAASANPAGLVMPRIDADDTPAARFYRDAFLTASSAYAAMGGDIFTPCGGTLAMAPQKQASLGEHGLWPDGGLRAAGDHIEVPRGGVLKPGAAVAALLAGSDVVDAPAEDFAIRDGGWWVTDRDGKEHGPFAAVVLATGAEQPLWTTAPIAASRGQIDVFSGPEISRVITDGSYVAPLDGRLVAGATYAPHDGQAIAPDAEDTARNRDAAAGLLGGAVGAHIAARAALRATTPDRHPLAGPLFDEAAVRVAYRGLAEGKREDYPPPPYRQGLHALTGLGSRGLVTAPLLAGHVVAQITGGVSPLSRPIAEMVHPGRFVIRDLRRGRTPVS